MEVYGSPQMFCSNGREDGVERQGEWRGRVERES